MTKMTFLKKRLVVAVVLILIAATAYVCFRMYGRSIGFTYFEPSYLPPNVSIKDKRISINRGYAVAGLNFRTEDWVYSIREDKAGESSQIGTAKQDYDPKSINPTCLIQRTPAQMRYRLCHWVDYGRIDVHEVSFIKSDTFIYSQIPTKTDQTISVDQIERYVDSFQLKATRGLPVLRSVGP